MAHIAGELADPSVKAFALDTPLLTAAGWTTVDHIRPGDTLFGCDGSPTEVVGTTAVTTYRTCHQFTFDDGALLVAHSGNWWRAINRGRRIRARATVTDWREHWDLAEFVIGHKMASRTFIGAGKASNFTVPLARPVDLPEAPLPLPSYVLGAWLGDGCRSSATMTTCDPWMLEEFRRQGMAVSARSARTKDRSVDFGFQIDDGRGRGPACHGTGKASLRQLGVLDNKHFPAAYMNSGAHQRLALLRGIMDTDGYCLANGRAAIEQRDEVIAAGVAELVRSLGWRAHMTRQQRPHPQIPGGTYRFWHVNFRPDQSPFALPRKADQWQEDARWDRRFTHRTLVRVDEVPRKQVRGIKVAASDGSFLVGRGLIPV